MPTRPNSSLEEINTSIQDQVNRWSVSDIEKQD